MLRIRVATAPLSLSGDDVIGQRAVDGIVANKKTRERNDRARA